MNELDEILERLEEIGEELKRLHTAHELPLPDGGTLLDDLIGEMRSLLIRWRDLAREQRGENPAT